jgi:hypothetical protein
MISPLEGPLTSSLRLARSSARLLAVLAIACSAPVAAQTPKASSVSLSFVTPDGRLACIAGQTGMGRPHDWRAIRDDGGPAGWALVEKAEDATDLRFPLCVTPQAFPRDLDLTLRFRPVSGSKYQAGGLLFRGQIATTYYVARADALEGSVRLYRMANGRRIGVGGKEVPVKTGTWHALRVRAVEDSFEVSLDGVSLFKATDRGLMRPGEVGVWTQGDSVTHFGSLMIGPP